MQVFKIFVCLCAVLILSCKSTDANTPTVVIDASEQKEEEIITVVATEDLDLAEKKAIEKTIFNVQLGIHPTQKNWVLFENGSYLIFPKKTSDDDMRLSAIKLLTSFTGTMVAQRKSALAKGWITTSKLRISNYVSPEQLNVSEPTDAQIRAQGMQNILKDIETQNIIRINGNN